MYELDIEDVPELLKKWNKRLRESQFAHYAAERHFNLMHYWLGGLATILTAIVGTTIFANANPDQLLIGFISLLAAVIVALQTFLNFAERAETHRASAASYGSLRREIESLHVLIKSEEGGLNLVDSVMSLKCKIDKLSEESPNVSNSIREKSIKTAKREESR